MKPHNCKKYWIMQDIIKPFEVVADSISEAVKSYAEFCEEKHYIAISKNAIKHKKEMYRDLPNGEAEQVGYVFTASCDFQDDQSRKWSKQFIELWATIKQVANAF